jgi:4-carboxymuconolactone decarboxylase
MSISPSRPDGSTARGVFTTRAVQTNEIIEPTQRAMNQFIAASAIVLALIMVSCSSPSAQSEQEAAAGASTAESEQITQPRVEARELSPGAVSQVAPALERYTQEQLYGEVWTRPGLSQRDRSIVTVAALIARSQTEALGYHVGLALDNGVEPSEISEIITHLAYYAGWRNAVGAVGPTQAVFTQREIGADQLAPARPDSLLPLDEDAEARREAAVDASYGSVAPGVVQYTTDALFRELWLRPGLAPRDRSLVTVSALIASGQPEQVSFHLGRAMDNGLTQEEASEALTQLAFYAGWPKVFSAMPVARSVFEERAD